MNTESGHSPRKIEPLPGHLSSTRQRCGKAGCRCARGELHGPYWSRFWRENGRRRRQYVQDADLDLVRAVIREWRHLHPPVRSTRALLTKLRRLTRTMEV